MHLTARNQMNSGKRTINHKIQGWNRNLGEMDIHLLTAMNAGYCPAVNNGQVKLGSKHTINTTLPSPSINKGIYPFYARNW